MNLTLQVAFWMSSGVAVVATAVALTRRHAVYALINVVVAMVAVAVVLYSLGAPFVAAFEIIVWAGAIMVMFLFVIMMLNLREVPSGERPGAATRIVPLLLALIVGGELAYVLIAPGAGPPPAKAISPQELGAAVYGPYLIGVELTSVLLLAGIAGAYHVGRQEARQTGEEEIVP
jgi:NADH-quinone oxidoreductase subunit J